MLDNNRCGRLCSCKCGATPSKGGTGEVPPKISFVSVASAFRTASGNTRSHYHDTLSRSAIVLLLAIGFCCAVPSRSHAAVRTVCASGCKYTSISAAIAAAEAGDTIKILDAVHIESNIVVDRSLTIEGLGANKTAVDGAQNGTIFTVDSGVTAKLQNLMIRNGLSNTYGGGILSDGTLTITNSALTGNFAYFGGGGIENGGTLSVTDSTFSDDSAAFGGGIENEGKLSVTDTVFSSNGAAGGGAIISADSMAIADSTFSANSATSGGAIYNYGPLNVMNSTFSGNSVGLQGGGIVNEATVTVTNSTFADNGFGLGAGAIVNDGTLTVANSTFSGNASCCGGVGGISGGNSGALVRGTILAGNTAGYGNTPSNCGGMIIDGGYNISDDATCGFSSTGSRNSTNPILDRAGLKDNGGPTETIALNSESPAIDAIPSADCTDQNSNPTYTDQRGALRPDPGEVACDIGAYEFQDFAGQAKCAAKSDSALIQQYGSLAAAAAAYGFSSAKQLNTAVQTSCKS